MNLFIALDFATEKEAWSKYQSVKHLNKHFKVGLELFTAAGPGFIERLVQDGAEIFLDLKFHDIPNTVAGALQSVSKLGIGWTNIHCLGGREMLLAAREVLDKEFSSRSNKPKLLGVTILTSMNQTSLQDVGINKSIEAEVKQLAELAVETGLDGIVCSGLELPLIKSLGKLETMVPGVRPESSNKNDQERITSPKQAKKFGASNIVVGRPIWQAKDPEAMVSEILKDIC